MANSRICSVPGCDNPVHGHGYCGNHYARWRRHGYPLGGRVTPGEPERFLRESVLTHKGDECLLWPFGTNNSGYALLRHNGSAAIVSRLVCEHVNGPPPTPKHQSAHSCGRGHLGCVAPTHLRWATRKVNESDKVLHGTHNRGERHGMAKLTEPQVQEILGLKRRLSQSKIAKIFGVSQSHVSRIHSRSRYRLS